MVYVLEFSKYTKGFKLLIAHLIIFYYSTLLNNYIGRLMHTTNIYKDKESDENPTHKRFLLVQKEGQRQVKRNIDHYNLDMIIALGYRVQSQIATRFRRWATKSNYYQQAPLFWNDERLIYNKTAYNPVSCTLLYYKSLGSSIIDFDSFCIRIFILSTNVN